MPGGIRYSINSTKNNLLHLDDAQYTSTNTTLTTQKTIRFIQDASHPITLLNILVSAWNESSSATTTIAANIDGGTNSTATTSDTSETVLNISDLAVPSTDGIHTLNLQMSTSNASYSAYTQLWEVYQS